MSCNDLAQSGHRLFSWATVWKGYCRDGVQIGYGLQRQGADQAWAAEMGTLRACHAEMGYAHGMGCKDWVLLEMSFRYWVCAEKGNILDIVAEMW